MIVPFFVVAGLVFYGYSHIFFFLFSYLRPLSAERRKILEKFPYYRKLSLKQKHVFENRVQRFISLKEFIPKQMDEVTREMKVLISASAVQLTFGLPEVQLADFDKILIYPKKYFSRINRRYHTGEVNPRGFIVIAWDAFIEGYNNPTDGQNVGLHEMAHALSLENIKSNYEENIFDKEAYENWKKVTEDEFKKNKRGLKSFLRNYAFHDKEEFFPVCIEYFFERPEEFKEERPELYEALCRLLNQDPLKKTDRILKEAAIY
ncbi:MAG: zinc-dependent peptidase [Cytophagaceae bacterium]|nr:zinc-dependent peptidase [Cytophagaceae bacterium]